MMWNHRVVSRVNEFAGEYFDIVEVYYTKDGSPFGYCTASIGGDSLDELDKQIQWFKTALLKPVLKYPEDFKGGLE
jgi:hypothetical protein